MRKGLAHRLALAGLTGLITLAVATPGASGAQHFMVVSEVATNPGANKSFIELQMYTAGQNFVSGHPVRFYTASGNLLASFLLNTDVANGGTQRTILIGDTATDGAPDFVYDQLYDAISTVGAGGAACWDTFDCVSWGNFTGAAMLPSPPGTPAQAIPANQSLVRSITPGCATLLESADDTNNSAADFALSATPSPRNNSTAPTETACGGGGGGGGDTDPPETTITKSPKDRTEKDKAKFKFKSDEANSTFMCKFDKKKFKPCSSPRTYKNLDEGKHKFKVKATDAAGNTDTTPAKDKFKVVDGD